jgi:hypothetical protein
LDAAVLAALAKWPDVPAVCGWLALTARSEWRLRGEPIRNRAIRDFFGRNYAGDDVGRWFVQNGPQRVYVDLEVAPWIWRTGPDAARPSLRSHTDVQVTQLNGAWLDEVGRVFLATELGFGLLDGADMAVLQPVLCTASGGQLAEALDALVGGAERERIYLSGAGLGVSGDAVLQTLAAADAERIFNFARAPRPE